MRWISRALMVTTLMAGCTADLERERADEVEDEVAAARLALYAGSVERDLDAWQRNAEPMGIVTIDGTSGPDRLVAEVDGETTYATLYRNGSATRSDRWPCTGGLMARLGDGDDIVDLRGCWAAIAVLAGNGDDEVRTGPGDDVVDLGGGHDGAALGGGDDRAHGGEGDDRLEGSDGRDRLWGGPGLDTLRGDGDPDLLVGGEDDDALFGGDGLDRIAGNEGNDTLHGEADRDILLGGDGRDQLYGGDGDDIVYGDAGGDLLVGEDGDDRMNGGDGDDMLRGGMGNDRMLGGDGRDLLDGEDGNDSLRGGGGGDLMFGGDGDDEVCGESGNDVLTGGAGSDAIGGGADSDWVSGDSVDGDDGSPDRVEGQGSGSGSGSDRTSCGEGDSCSRGFTDGANPPCGGDSGGGDGGTADGGVPDSGGDGGGGSGGGESGGGGSGDAGGPLDLPDPWEPEPIDPDPIPDGCTEYPPGESWSSSFNMSVAVQTETELCRGPWAWSDKIGFTAARAVTEEYELDECVETTKATGGLEAEVVLCGHGFAGGGESTDRTTNRYCVECWSPPEATCTDRSCTEDYEQTKVKGAYKPDWSFDVIKDYLRWSRHGDGRRRPSPWDPTSYVDITANINASLGYAYQGHGSTRWGVPDDLLPEGCSGCTQCQHDGATHRVHVNVNANGKLRFGRTGHFPRAGRPVRREDMTEWLGLEANFKATLNVGGYYRWATQAGECGYADESEWGGSAKLCWEVSFKAKLFIIEFGTKTFGDCYDIWEEDL